MLSKVNSVNCVTLRYRLPFWIIYVPRFSPLFFSHILVTYLPIIGVIKRDFKLKATIRFHLDWLGLSCFVQLLTWLQVSDYHNLWYHKRWYSSNVYLLNKQSFMSGTSSKMASTLSHKRLTIFCQKSQNCVYFVQFGFVQISSACGSNTYQIMYGEISDFQCQRQ